MKIHNFNQASQSLAIRYNQNAIQLQRRGQIAEAVSYYQKAIKFWPGWSTPWFNLGLLRQKQRNWAESLRCNQRAVKLDPSEQEAWWNLGIAATALEDWAEARRAWESYGIEIPIGEGPIVMDIGLAPIRIRHYDEYEVVWCERIDPARSIIHSVPLPSSHHRHGDLLLNGGAPNGFRKVDDKEVPVFDEIQLLTPSEFGTFEIIASGVTNEDFDNLDNLATKDGLAIEDWSSNLRVVCKTHSEDTLISKRGPELEKTDLRRIGFAAHSELQVREIVRRWLNKKRMLKIIGISCLLEPF